MTNMKTKQSITCKGVNDLEQILNEIIVTTPDGEVLTSVTDEDVIASDKVVVRLNYGKPHTYKDVDGKVYIEEKE